MMTSTMTQDRLDAIAPQLWTEAREAAHAAGCDTAEEYAFEYVRATARLCGEQAAEQCAPGETWNPTGWLPGDELAVTEAVAQMEVCTNGAFGRELFALYRGE